jgi:hypothetical protein
MGETVHRKAAEVTIEEFQMRYHTVRQGLLKLHELFGNSLPVYLGAVLHSGELGASIYPDLLLNGRAKISEEWSDFSAGIQSLL